MRVRYIIYVEEFGEWPYIIGTEKVLVRAKNIYEAEIRAIGIIKKKVCCNSRHQEKAVNENKIYFNTKLLF